MVSKGFTRNLIIAILCFLFVSILYLINNSISDDYPEMSEARYIVKESIAAGDAADFSQEDAICYREEDINAGLFPDCYYVLLIDDSNLEVLAAKKAHQRMYPASMTKVMTAIVVADAVESGEISLEDVVTVSEHYDLTQHDVAPCQLHPGYRITVKDLVYGLMIESNNYYALMLAKYIGGDVDSFCLRMNEKAVEIGATNTHFVNPHGLDDPKHYTTAYDMYLIFKEARSHDLLREIDKFETYSYTYKDADGVTVEAESTASNQFVTGNVALPAGFSIEAWKTGTTNGAGHCLAMYVTKDGKNYFVVSSTGESKQVLYDSLIKLLCLIN